MRNLLLLLAVALPLSACAVQPGPSNGPARIQPLRAYITPPDGRGLGFHVNRSAHVALFEILPGRGTSLLYPSPGYGSMDAFTFGGTRTLGWGRRTNSELYRPGLGGVLGGPRFFFLVASERPLNLERIGGYGMGLSSAMGVSFASLNAYSAMERLAEIVVPDVGADDWTSDLYVYWPDVVSPYNRRGLVEVSCNGMRMYVDARYLMEADGLICSPSRNGNRPPVLGDTTSTRDSATVVPRRREPMPKAGEGLRRRITESEHFAPDGRAAERGSDSNDRLERRTRAGRRSLERPMERGGTGSRAVKAGTGTRQESPPRAEPRSSERERSSPPATVDRRERRDPPARAGGAGDPPVRTREAPPKKGSCDPCSES